MEIERRNIQSCGGTAVASGLYRVSLFRRGAPEGARARFGFTCLKRGQRPQIVNHHSSVVAEGFGTAKHFRRSAKRILSDGAERKN